MNARSALILPALALLWAAGCEADPPYFSGVPPVVDAIDPTWENGNVGGQIVLAYIDDLGEMTEEERLLLNQHVVTISGDFSECPTPLVTFANRNAEIVDSNDSALSVLTPPGPISGGLVEVAIVCQSGVKRLPDGYDYVIGDATQVGVSVADMATLREENPDVEGLVCPPEVNESAAHDLCPPSEYLNPRGEPARRLESLYADEYASMAIIYPAEPFINWPAPQLIGFVHDQPTPRQSAYYLTNGQPELIYGGVPVEVFDADGPYPQHLAQQPGVEWEAAPMGEEVSAGDAISFFRRRDTATADPLRNAAQKIRNQNPLAPDPNRPAPDDLQTPNSDGIWFEIQHNGTTHFLRAAQWTGDWCADNEGREGCVDDAIEEADIAENLRLDNVRVGFDWRPRWFTPDAPERATLEDYPEAAPEFVSYLDCVDAGGEELDCLAEVGFQIPSGTYQNVRIIASQDKEDSWPWLADGFIRVVEVVPELSIESGGNYIDLPELAVGQALLDDSNPNRIYYLAESLGENVMPRGEPSYISYPGGFYRGVSVPERNPNMEYPDCTDDGSPPAPGTDCYDLFPWVQAPNVQIGTFFNTDTIGAVTQNLTVDDPRDPLGGTVDLEFSVAGFNFWIPLNQQLPGFEDDELVSDWRVALPGGMRINTDPDPTAPDYIREETDLGEGVWGDRTFIVAEMGVRDIDTASGFGANWLWRTKLWAWAGDDYIVFPKEQLATLPRIGDIGRPDTEEMVNDNLIGVYTFNVRRVASFPIGEPFNNADGRMVFDLNAISNYYFRTEHSCFDGYDNDRDGMCDVAGCNDPNNPDERLPADPACSDSTTPENETAECQNGEDDDEDGLTDAEDPDCENPNDPDERTTCADGVDNDWDGWTDLRDPGCVDSEDHYEYDETNPQTPPRDFDADHSNGLIPPDAYRYGYTTECNDGIDDDADGAVDSQDPGCEDGLDDTEGGDACGDGVDNNGDGWIDFEDITCRPGSGLEPEGPYSPSDTVLFDCSDADRFLQPDGTFLELPIDNDDDGLANADDPDCGFGWDESGEAAPPLACADLIDNDGDGWIDGADAQCDGFPESEANGFTSSGGCADGIDNDTDGWIDVDDPDCSHGAGDEAIYSTVLECNDHDDNDGDGLIDSEDPECISGKDIHEDH